jgi:uncharacterized integral membrane protein (TIGR00698 family)
VIRNLAFREPPAAAGMSVHYVLRLAIILLGSSLGLSDVVSRGSQTLALIVALIAVAMALGFGLGRIFNLSNAVSTLIGVGTAICGASAILVISPLVKAKSEETAYALTTIFSFNLAALLLPLDRPPVGYAPGFIRYLGWHTAVNDTSVVVAMGYIFSSGAGAAATVVKLTRTTLLLPVAIIVGMMQKDQSSTDWKARVLHAIPWFVLGFLGMSVARSVGAIPSSWLGPMAGMASFLIVCVLGAVGLNTDLKSIVRLGPRPLAVGLLLATIMGVLSLAAIEGLHLN